MKKVIFLGAGSEKDPGYEGCYDKKGLAEKGITVIEPMVIESCHGCPDLMTKYSGQMQSLVEKGDRVVGVLQGGLLFGLPSIQATQVTYPIISCPLDLVAYTAFITPPGHAAIATVGIDRKKDEKYETNQRQKAIMLAEKMLNLESQTIALIGDGDLEKIAKELDNLGIRTHDSSALVLTYGHMPQPAGSDCIQLWAHCAENLMSGTYLERAEAVINMDPDSVNAAQVRASNLAIYAAKILSLQNPELREKIKGIAKKKRAGYPDRDLLAELGGIERRLSEPPCKLGGK